MGADVELFPAAGESLDCLPFLFSASTMPLLSARGSESQWKAWLPSTQSHGYYLPSASAAKRGSESKLIEGLAKDDENEDENEVQFAPRRTALLSHLSGELSQQITATWQTSLPNNSPPPTSFNQDTSLLYADRRPRSWETSVAAGK